MALMAEFPFDRIENIVAKEENDRNHLCLLFPLYFPKGHLKLGLSGTELTTVEDLTVNGRATSLSPLLLSHARCQAFRLS